LIFLLFNGYFTLPIIDEQLSTSTYLPENHLLTTAETLNLRLVTDDESSTLSDVNPKRSTDEHMEFEMSTSIAGLGEEISPALRSIEEFSTSEPMSITTEQAREDNNLSYTTVESTTEFAQLSRRGFTNELENNTQEMKVELTTNDMSSFISTSSSVGEVSKVSTSKSSSSISTSTEKYIGLLKDDNEYDEEEQSTKYTKIQRKSSGKKSKVYPEDKSDDEESAVPTALFDQKALDRVPNIPNDFLMLDESNDFVVTSLSNRIFPSTTTHQNIKEEKEDMQPLNQGKNSAHTEEKESNN